MVITAAQPDDKPSPENHAVLAKLAEADPGRAQRIARDLQELVSRNDAFFTWIEAKPERGTLFVQDPVAAIKQALPDLPPDFFAVWTAK